MGFLARVFGSKQKAAEGEYRPGPYLLDGGWLSAAAGKYMNWWQMGYSPQPFGEAGAMVEACVSAYAQTVAMCPGDHWLADGQGGRVRITTSDLSRIMRCPNDYQTISDFLLNLTRRLYAKGESFALAIRDDAHRISELHWMRDGWPLVAEDGSVFYWLSGNEIVERRFDLSTPIPARDVMHVRLHTPRHHLKGESPLMAAQLELMMLGAALNQQVAFYINQARPSFILETDQKLTKAEADDLRARWDAHTKGENAGGTPIASWGLKAKPVTTGSGADAQLAEIMKMSNESIAHTMRVPLQILGAGDKTPYASTEALMSSWKGGGLGFALEQIENAFGKLFGLSGGREEYLELDTNALMRSNFKERIDALSVATRRVYTINEARSEEGLPRVAGGDEILVQNQDVPLSMAGKKVELPAPAPQPTPVDPAEEQLSAITALAAWEAKSHLSPSGARPY